MSLKTETNTRAMESKVRAAAVHTLEIPARDIQSDFEHGQWWITQKSTGAQWSVVDSVGGFGFEFEQVSQGEEEY